MVVFPKVLSDCEEILGMHIPPRGRFGHTGRDCAAEDSREAVFIWAPASFTHMATSTVKPEELILDEAIQHPTQELPGRITIARLGPGWAQEFES